MNRNNDALRFRRCLCGCEKPIPITSRRRYYNEVHKMRAYRERRKSGKVKPQKSSPPVKRRDPADREIDEILQHVLRRGLEKGELSECAVCRKLYDITSTSDPDYCPSCSRLKSPSSEH